MKSRTNEVRDTIPRLQQLVPHMRDQLTGLRHGSTFEHARRRYADTVDRLDSQGLGRRTASRVGDRDQYWSPTRDVLDEAMRLGFVERQQLPSSRRYVDAHRNRQHTLTQLGLQAAEEAETDMAAFCDRLAAAVYDNHPYFRAFIDTLQDGPIGCPEVAEGEVEEARCRGKNTEYWVEIASQRIPRQTISGDNKARIRETIVAVVRHRFGQTLERLPTSKQMAEALNDAYIEAALRLCGLSIGAIDLKVMKKWGSQLMLLDESRYVPAFTGQNIIWLAADVSDNGDVRIQRRALQNYERPVAEAVVAAYKAQAGTEETSLKAPYLPIYRVRAQAAFECQVNTRPRRHGHRAAGRWLHALPPRSSVAPPREHATAGFGTDLSTRRQASIRNHDPVPRHLKKETIMAVDALDHMQEAWNLETNPFPAEAIHAQNAPYCPTAFGEESREFRRKLIRGSRSRQRKRGLPLVARRARGHRLRQDDLDA